MCGGSYIGSTPFGRSKKILLGIYAGGGSSDVRVNYKSRDYNTYKRPVGDLQESNSEHVSETEEISHSGNFSS